MLAAFRADAARGRDELCADLRARAERAERQADAYRDELTQLRAATGPVTGSTSSGTILPRPAAHPAVAATSRRPAAPRFTAAVGSPSLAHHDAPVVTAIMSFGRGRPVVKVTVA
jgi:hypothetical protein